jgi:hypothetical protein
MTATQFYGGGGNLTGVGVDGIVSTANATAITIDSNENVGIGTSSPDNTTYFGRVVHVAGQSNAGIMFERTANAAKWSVGTHSSGDMVVVNGGTEKARFSSTGGITFNGDTSANNALDDYEEGTWTGAFIVASGSATMNSAFDTGRYTKIGRFVHVQGNFACHPTSSPSGYFTITGLPFSSGSDQDQSEFSYFSIFANNITANAGKPVYGYIGSNENFITVYTSDGNNVGNAGHILQNNAYLGFSAVYTV